LTPAGSRHWAVAVPSVVRPNPWAFEIALVLNNARRSPFQRKHKAIWYDATDVDGIPYEKTSTGDLKSTLDFLFIPKSLFLSPFFFFCVRLVGHQELDSVCTRAPG